MQIALHFTPTIATTLADPPRLEPGCLGHALGCAAGPRAEQHSGAITEKALPPSALRYGYRRIRRLLVDEGWQVNVKRVYRIWRREPLGERYCESFNPKLRDELLNVELFSTLYEAEVLIESWRPHYNVVRPHSSVGYRPPAPEAILPPARGLPYAPLRPAHGLGNTAES